MFINKVNPVTGNPICAIADCGEDVLPNEMATEHTKGVLWKTKDGLAIVHAKCALYDN